MEKTEREKQKIKALNSLDALNNVLLDVITPSIGIFNRYDVFLNILHRETSLVTDLVNKAITDEEMENAMFITKRFIKNSLENNNHHNVLVRYKNKIKGKEAFDYVKQQEPKN